MENPFDPFVVEDIGGESEIDVVALEGCEIEPGCVDFVLFESFCDPL